jgi:hypothetical protein
LKPSINTKELCKLIKLNSKRGAVIWSREADRHFVTNRHHMAHFKELPNDVLAVLFGVFYKIAEVGQTLTSIGGYVESDPKPIKYDGIYQPDEQDLLGVHTDYLRDIGDKRTARVIMFPERKLLVDSEYLKLSAGELFPRTAGNLPNSPVYFADGNLLILPYRISNDDVAMLNDILGDKTE